MGDLPSWLLRAAERHLEGRSRGDLADRAGRISAAYRAGRASAAVVRGDADALAYAVARMPATFAAARRVFAEIEALLPDFAPASVLDAGAGPGTAGFAAAHAWNSVAELTQVDHNAAFLALAARFADAGAGAPHFRLRQVAAELGDLPEALGRFDLAVACYVLAEFDADAAADLAVRLWRHAAGALAIVEPGTPEGYRRIVAARDRLIAAGARILAPCPHEVACPLVAPDWCHFSERLPRRRAHMAAKGAALPFEDERFAYLVAVREPPSGRSEQARIVARPDASKAGIRLKLCRPDGSASTQTVARRDRRRFAGARRLDWGDRFDPDADAEPPDAL